MYGASPMDRELQDHSAAVMQVLDVAGQILSSILGPRRVPFPPFRD